MPLQIRRGTDAERQAMTVPLASGEPLWITDDQRLYIGNGTTLPGSLTSVTGYTDEDAQEAVAELLLGANPITAADNSRHIGIVFVYDDDADRIDATVDFSGIPVLEADAFKGSLFADDSTLLVDAVAGSINLVGTVKGDIIPNASEVYDIGSAGARFRDLYLSGSSIKLGDATITAAGTVVNLPVGSTVGGVEIGLATESIVRDLEGSVIGEDSTILVDATSNSFSTGRIDISENIISSRFDILVLSGQNIPEESQTQVVIPTLTAPTGTETDEDSTTKFSLIRATSKWNMFSITAHKNSTSAPEEVGPGEVLGVISLGGFQPGAGDNGKSFSSRMGVHVDPAGTTTSTYLPSKLFWVNQPSTEVLAEDENNQPLMTFDSFGRLAVNQENAQATLDVNGFAKLAILTAPPATLANGMIAIADGTSWDPLGAAGKQQMVVYLGGAWRAIAQEP
jgi:hypothetical protein